MVDVFYIGTVVICQNNKSSLIVCEHTSVFYENISRRQLYNSIYSETNLTVVPDILKQTLFDSIIKDTYLTFRISFHWYYKPHPTEAYPISKAVYFTLRIRIG